jgi:phosphate starvation-inducible PhoH-like protein
MGKSAKFMITGDPGLDLPRRTYWTKRSFVGFKDIDGIGIIYLDDKDIVRHRLVKKVIDAYKMIENND